MSSTKLLSNVLIAIFAITLFSCSSVDEKSKEQVVKQKPNIIWISFEDISPIFSFYGDNTAKTPHLDKLAEESVIYDRVFSTAGVCAPSRSAIITGMYPTYMGTNHMRTAKDITGWSKGIYRKEKGVKDINGNNVIEYSAVIPSNIKCFPEYLRAEGYYCTNNQKTDYQFAPPFTAWDENSANAHWKNRDGNQPFFSVFNLNVTHESMLWKNKALDQTVSPKEVKVASYFPDHDSIKVDVARQYSNVELLDKQVNRLLQELKDAGVYDNSYIFFFSDHGGALPRGKREVLASGLNVPLLIKYPKGMSADKRDDKLVSFIDLAPTVLDIAGVEVPEHIQGESILSSDREYIYAARDRMDESNTRRRTVSDGRFIYVKHLLGKEKNYKDIAYRFNLTSMRTLYSMYNNGELNKTQSMWFEEIQADEELYDLKNDPDEVSNLATNPDYIEDLERLRLSLDRWMEEYNDRSLMPEADMIEEMWPGGNQPQTTEVNYSYDGDKVILNSKTEGASIGYSYDGKTWEVYSKPFVPNSDSIMFKAIRIGYKESEITTMESKL